jgi:hypothetical protein
MASAGTIERAYKVSVDATEAIRQLEKIADSTGSLDKAFEAMQDRVKDLGKDILKGLAIEKLIEYAAEAVEKIKGLAESFDQLGKDAQKIGVSIEDLQRLRFAAGLAGVGAEDLDHAIGKLAENMQKMNTVTDVATQTLKTMGVRANDTSLAAIEKVADRFAKMPDGVEKAAEAIALFGKQGLAMIPFLNQGAEGIRKLAEEADKFGGVISQKVADQAGQFNDNLAKLERVSAGAWAQLTVGLIPALVALTKYLTETTKSGDGFKTWGENVGSAVINTTIAITYLWNAAQKAAVTLEALTLIRLKPAQTVDIAKQWYEQIKAIGEATPAVIKLLADFKQAMEDASKPADKPPGKTSADNMADALERQKLALERFSAQLKAEGEQEMREGDEHQRQGEAILKITLETTQAMEDQKQVEVGLAAARAAGARETSEAEKRAADVRSKTIDELNRYTASLGDTATQTQVYYELLDDLAGKYDEVSNRQREWIQAQLNGPPALKKVSEEVAALQSGFDRFVDTLSSGSVTVAQAFKAMAQSIIADLLKIWAKKYIIDALSELWGVSTSSGGAGGGAPPGAYNPGAFGLTFDAGHVVPFAAGGVVMGPLRMPMALMGEAGPEAVMPLQRTADGTLGVRAQVPPLNVAIHNHTDATVSARRDGNGDLAILIETTKREIANDIRRGGNDVARAAEAAWRLSRGAAAPY